MSVENSGGGSPRLAGRLWRHFKRNFLGYTALVIAISMTPLPAYAASKIGAKQLKKNAVTTVKIKNGAVTTPKLAAKAVTSDKLAKGAVDSEAIKDGAVSAGDLASGAAYKDIVVVKKDDLSVPQGTGKSMDVLCPTGYMAIGGGASATGGLSKGVLKLSVPIKWKTAFPFGYGPVGDGQVPTGWRTELELDTDSGTQTIYHYAICASK